MNGPFECQPYSNASVNDLKIKYLQLYNDMKSEQFNPRLMNKSNLKKLSKSKLIELLLKQERRIDPKLS